MLASFFDSLLATLFIIICLLLIGVVLLQKGRGGGLSAAFGGMGSSAFGTRVGDVLTWVTIVMTALFLLLATAVTLSFKPSQQPVAAPVFAPEAGTPIRTATPVSITCATAGANIYYTLDEGEPTKQSKLYAGPFDVKPGQTVKARAFLEGQPASEITKGTYIEDRSKPEPLVGPGPQTRPAATTAPAPVSPPASRPASASAPAPAPAPATAPAG